MRFHIRNSRFFSLFNFREELARGRSCMLLSSVIVSVISWLTTGLFYTSFLMTNGIDIVKIGILTFVPYIANCFSIFSPSILERFKKRKSILAISRAAYYALNILGITVLPNFVGDPTTKMVLFVAIVFAANIINALFGSGYSVWQVNFIPERVRAEYFSTNTMITAFIGCGAALVSSVVADALASTPYEDLIIVAFRYVAFVLGLVDVLILSLPREFPYLQTQDRPKLTDIFVKPFGHKKFALTMAMVFAWTFCINVPLSSLNFYLINDVGVEYTFIYTINMFYPFILLIFLPPWKKILNRLGWFKTFAYAAMLHIPTSLMYSCVTSETYLWALPTLRMLQHLFGVGMNVAYANMAYINLPKTDQTNYIAFHTLVLNIGSFLGMMAGTSFVAAYPDIVVNLFGLTFTNVQMLLWVEALGELLVPLAILKLLPQLTPEES